MALLEEAEAEAAEAEALAAAARARARVARLRREAQEKSEAAEAESAESTQVGDTEAEAKSESAEITEVETADPQGPDVEESDPETDEETVEAAVPESRRRRRIRAASRLPSLSATFKVVAIILICAFAGASGYMVWEDHNAAERRQRAANFIAGAKQGVINMASLDFHRAKEDVQRLLDSSTGQFRDEFQQRAKDFVTVVEESQVITQGTINAAAVESMDEHSASVLVSATSTITNADGAKDEPRVWRLRVTVTEEGGQYKMSKLEFVP
nr:hypothetical protein [Mycobacterium bourgelatii]